jgi:phosphatidylglycerophosphatase A
MTLARLIASGFGSGLFGIAPGTVGSLAALVIGAGLLMLPVYVLPLAIIGITLAGFWAIPRAGGSNDPGWVVVDEFAGQWIAILPLSHPSPLGLLTAFGLFRLLDITKPGPIGAADRMNSAIGIMADDVLAGLLGAVILWALLAWKPMLLG